MKKYWFPITVCILMLLVSILTYSTLPTKIPMNFGIHGQMDSYRDKIHIFTIPLMLTVMTVIMILLPRIDPYHANYVKFQKSYHTFINVFTLFTTMIFAITVYSAYYPNSLDATMIITIAVGLLFSWMGNILPKFRRNYFNGIPCPWTLSNDLVWFLTHRFAGKTWMIGGFLIMVSAFLPVPIRLLITYALILFMTFVPMIYSYFKYKKIKKENEND